MKEPFILESSSEHSQYYNDSDFLHLGPGFSGFMDQYGGNAAITEEIAALGSQIWEYIFIDNIEGYPVNDSIFVHPVNSSSPCTDRHYPIVININPLHAFGDGKHPTTILCLRYLSEYLGRIDDEKRAGVKIIDVGTGTGILSILASKMGASLIEAIDLNAASMESAFENFTINDCRGISLRQADIASFDKNASYDMVLANLISDVIIPNLKHLTDLMKPDGIMIASGISAIRNEEVRKHFNLAGLEALDFAHLDGWYGYVLKLSRNQ
ncbi:MAG: 50S ribosomal protein L11 methyltransferase [Spirochaetes bacterium]|jgi:ribosomal protein L11 methyltransferase|nr:50S ribosomal protein L11 methyltransferase [Spirochaetota bacterium]